MGAFTDDEYNYGLNLLKAKAHRPEQNAANEQRADAMGIPLGVAELDDNADTATARDWAKTDEERKAITKVMAASPEAARIGWMDRTFGKYAVKVASLLSSPQANPQNEAAIAEKYALTGAMVGELRHERSLIESTMSPSSEENDRLEGEYLMQEGSSERMQSLKDALARPFSESRSIANRAGFGASSGITRDYLDGIYGELGITPDNKGEYVAANKVATRALASDASAMMLLNELYGERWKELPDGHIGMLLSDIEKRTGIDLSLSNPSRMKAITRINPAEAANLFGIPELLWRSVTDPGNEDTRNKYNLGFPFALAEQADAQRGRTWIDRQANGLAHSLRFMGQHAITNFLTGGASAFANAGLLGKAGIALGESALLTTADTQGLSDTADTLRSRDMSYLDRDGNVVTVTPEKRDEMADLFVRSFASNFIENGSEWLGEFLPKMGGVSPFRRFYNKMVGRTPMKDALADFGANTLYNGLFGEMFEEVASKAAKGAMTELSEKYDIKQIDLGEDLKFDGAWFRDTFIQIAAQQAIMFGTGASAQKALNAMHRDDVSVFSLRQNATEVSDLMRGDTSFGGANITDAQRLVHLNEMKIGDQRLTLKLSDAAELMKRNPDACKALGITEESIGEAAKAGRSSMDLSVADFIAYRGGSANDVKFADEVMDATVGSGNVIAVTKRGATMREVEDALSESAESYRAREAAKRMVAEEIGRAVRENPNMAVNVELVASAAGGIIDYLSREGGMDISDFVERFKVLVSERPAELMSASSIQSLVPEDVRTLMDRKSDANVKLVDALARRFGVGDVVWATEDDLQEEQKASGVDAALINGWYVARNGETGKDEIHIAPSAAVRFTFGHELFHRIQAVSPEIAGEIHSILSDNGMLSGVLQRKMNAIRDAYSSVNGSVSEDEFSADMLGYVMNDLRFAQALARRLEEKSSGAGEKFLQAAIEAVDVVLSHLARLGSRSYQAEFLFNDYARKKELLTNLLVDFSERFGGVQPDVSTAENRKSKKSSKGRKYSIGNNENFRRWFGDSKVVDENGEPLVVYHGTEYGWFTAFDKSMARSEPGIWLTSSKALADEYAEDYENRGRPAAESKVYDCYARIEHPYVIEADGRTYDELEDELYEAANNEEYDGIIVRNVIDHRFGDSKIGPVDTFMVKDGSQVKSASENNGDYSLENSDIRFSIQTPADNSLANNQASFVELVSNAENRKSKKSSKGRKYSIGGLYTGTPHDYARKDENGNISNPPSLNSIGRGEGAYVYGYGLYATDNREIAEWYARSVGERHSEKVIKFDGKSYSDRIYEDRESLANDIKKKVEEIYANRFGKEKLEKRKKDKDSWLSDSLYHEIAVDRLFEDFKGSFDSANTSLFNYSWAYALNMVKDLLDYEVKTPDKYIYEQTFFNDGSGIVDWYSVASEEDVERIKSSIIPTFVNEGADDEAKDFIEDNFYVDIKQGDTYGEIYNKISEFIDEEMIDYEYVYKDKSKFATDVFLTSGIYGVRYPAKSRNGIKDGNEVGWNYVTFKDDNIEVNHKWRNGEKIYSIQTPADNSLANNQASFVELVSNADSIDAIREIAVWAYGMARSMVDNGMDQRGRIATSLAIIDEWLESDALKNPYEHGTFQHDEYKRRRFGDAFVRYVAESNPSAMADGIVKDAMRELKKIAKSAYASVASAIPRVPSAVSAVFGSMVDADSTIDDSTDFRLMANLLRSEAAKGYLGTGQSMLYDLVRKAEEKAKDVQSAKIQEILKVLRRQWEQEASDVADGMGRYRAEAEIAGAGGFTPKIADLAGYATEEGSDDAKAVRYGLDARKLVSKDSSMTLDDALSIASKNGYDDIETMVRDIVDNPTRQEYVAQFADSAQDAWLKAASFDADEEAIANDYAITALEQLEETLSSRLGAQKAFGKVAMQGIQQNRILKSTVSDVRGNSMVADTRVKIGELVEILGRKNVDDRKVLEKIGEIRANMEYLRQVGAEKALIDRNVAMMKKAFSAKKGVIQGEYQDAIMELGNFFGITSRKYVPGSLAKIMDVLKGQEDDENCFEDRTDIDTFFTDLTDILRRNEGLDWHRMTTADFDRVADAIRYLEYLGRGEVKDAKRGFWGKVRDQVDYFVREIGTDGKYTDYSDKTAIESAASVWRRGVSSTYNMNFMLGRTGRVGKEFVVEWVSKPSTRELGLMQDVYGEIRPLMSEFASEFAKVQKMVDDGRIYLEHDGSRYRRISDYLDAILPINNHKNGDYQGYKKWCNDGDDRSTASHMMMMALYLGTESGRQRIMDGYALRAPQDAIEADDSELSGIFQPFLSLFTGRQLEIINSIWDAIARGSLTDEVAKAYGEVNHSVFRTIPASPFIVARSVDGRTNVEMRGGYIPLNYLYHDRNSAKANESSAYATPDFKTTSSVNRRSDVIRDTYPLSLEDNVLFQHVRDSAHYATHRVPMSFAFKVIGDSDFKAAYTKRYSAEDYKALVKAFRRVSCPMTKERTAFTWIENAARYITIARAFIGNIPVALMQATSITVGATELGGYLNRAIMRYMQSPIDDVRRARELSPLMRERAKMQDVDMRRAYERMHGTKFENFRTSVLEIGTLPMHFMDNIVAVIQFNAAYDKAIDEGMSSLDAVAYAENFVASTQGAARQMDMTGFQDDTRFLSLFMSATSAMYNRTLLDFSTESGFRKYVSLACNQMIPMMSAMVVRYIANGGWMSGDGDDEWYETPASRAAIREMLTSPFSGIPYANIISDVVAEMAINGRIKEDAFSIPSLGIVTDSTRSIIKALKASRDDDADFAIYNFAKAVSDMAGIPVVTAHERIVKMLKSWNIDEINDAIEPIDLKEGLDDSK